MEDLVETPTHPGKLTGNTNAAKYTYKEQLNQYHTFQAVDAAGVRLIHHIFDRQYFVDLEDGDGEILGYDVNYLLTHLDSTFTTIMDTRETLDNMDADLQKPFDLSEPPQGYWKHLQQCRYTSIKLEDTLS